MTFLNWLGLLGLLGLVFLIIIYILKPKYQEQVISSSFIWKLSLKYKKKKIPFEWLKSSLILILQVLIILTITAILMEPNLVLATDSGEKIVILDVSASMLAEKNDETRLDRAIDEIDRLAKQTINNNDRFSLIIAGNDSVLLANRSDSYEFVKTKLQQIEPQYGLSNIDDAMLLTEDIIELNPSTEIIYYTSQSFNDPGTVTIKNMSENEWNVAILDFEGGFDLSFNYIFTVELASYGRDISDLIVELNIDGHRENSTAIDLVDGKVTSFSWQVSEYNADNYETASVRLLEIDDDFTYDNELSFYSGNQQFRIQLVSEESAENIDSTKAYVISALNALTRDYQIITVDDIEEAETQGFDLYIYSETTPETLPKDGAVWIFDPEILPVELGLSVIGENTIDNGHLVGNESAYETYEAIMSGVRPDQITVSKYRTLSLPINYDILLQYNTDPMLLTRTIDGVKVSIFTFGLSHSNLPILFLDFPVLIRNLSNYSVIPTFDQYIYDAESDITFNVNPMTDSMTIANGDLIETYDTFPVVQHVSALGTYQVVQLYRDGQTKIETFYVRIARSESDFSTQGDVILSPAVSQEVNQSFIKEDLRSLIPYFAIALLVLIMVEWEVQYREQY